jgi:hypothetical protein
MRIMGHFSITVSQRYVHPTPETMENASIVIEVAGRRAEEKQEKQEKVENPAALTTDLTTSRAGRRRSDTVTY